MKIKLVNVLRLKRDTFPPYGLGILRTYLEKQNVDVDIFDLDIVVKNLNSKNNNKRIDTDYIKSKISNYPSYLKDEIKDDYFDRQIEEMISLLNIKGGEILGFHIPQRQLFFSLYLAKKIKEIKDCAIIFGGIHLNKIGSGNLQIIIKEFDIDYVDHFVVGDAYSFFDQLVSNEISIKNQAPRVGSYPSSKKRTYLSLSQKEGIPTFNQEHLELYRIRPEKLKYFFDSNKNITKKFEELKGSKTPLVVPYRFKLGCSNSCFYCSTLKNTETFSLEKISRDISSLSKNYNTDNFYFCNNDISFKSDYINQLLKSFREHNIKWSDSANVRNMNPELVKKFGEAGCIQLYMGLVTASRKLQNYLWGKANYNRNEHISKCFKATDDNGIWFTTDVICGLPYERLSDILKTRQFLLRHKDYINGVFLPTFRLMKNSPLESNPKNYGLYVHENNYSLKNKSDKFSLDFYRYPSLRFSEKYGFSLHKKKKQVDFSYKYFKNFIDQTFPNQTIDWYPVYLLYNNFDSKKEIKKFLYSN